MVVHDIGNQASRDTRVQTHRGEGLSALNKITKRTVNTKSPTDAISSLLQAQSQAYSRSPFSQDDVNEKDYDRSVIALWCLPPCPLPLFPFKKFSSEEIEVNCFSP